MQDYVVATYVEDETFDRVYVWASGVETWYDREAGFWSSHRIRNPTEVAEAKAERDARHAAFLKATTPRETV